MVGIAYPLQCRSTRPKLFTPTRTRVFLTGTDLAAPNRSRRNQASRSLPENGPDQREQRHKLSLRPLLRCLHFFAHLKTSNSVADRLAPAKNQQIFLVDLPADLRDVL